MTCSGFSFEAGGRTFCPVVWHSLSCTLISIFEVFFFNHMCFYSSNSWTYWLEDNRICNKFFETAKLLFPFHLNVIGVAISLSFLLDLKGNPLAKPTRRVGRTLFICWRNEENKEFFLRRPRENKVRLSLRAWWFWMSVSFYWRWAVEREIFSLTKKTQNNLLFPYQLSNFIKNFSFRIKLCVAGLG